jgi:hypothetical protein
MKSIAAAVLKYLSFVAAIAFLPTNTYNTLKIKEKDIIDKYQSTLKP